MASSIDDVKRLKAIYESVEKMILSDDYDEDLRKELETAYPDYMTVLETAKRDLLRNDCGIVVAGETSAGKSTLINVLVKTKKPLFKPGILATTAAITRIRNMNEYSIRTFTKDEVLMEEKKFETLKDLRCALKNLSDMEALSENMKGKLHFIDVHLPVSILKGNAIIVDTPGIGENSNLDSMLIEFLPHAVAFIFVVNVRNAGGITSDRLGKILSTIFENRRKMPCFDMKDALFLTNCWDAVEADSVPVHALDASDSDSSSDEENEVEKVWQKVKRVISDSWVELPEQNIFRVSLRQKQQGVKNWYTEEYERFESRLNETIDQNMNKRCQFYFQFIANFHKKAITGTLARLQLFERSKDEHMKIMKETQANIYTLEKECRERKQLLRKLKDELTKELAEKLHAYLQSDRGRHEILNPPGECAIGEVSIRSINSEVERRIKYGINRWCKQDEATIIIRRADSLIKNNLLYIETQIKTIELGLLGFNTIVTFGLSLGFMFEASLGLGLLAFPISIIFVVAFFALVTPFLVAFAWFCGAGYVRDTAIKNYNGIISRITVVHLIDGFEKSIGREIERIVTDVFDDTMPKKIESYRNINRKLQDEYKVIKTKRKSITRMKSQIESVGDQLKTFREMCLKTQ